MTKFAQVSRFNGKGWGCYVYAANGSLIEKAAETTTKKVALEVAKDLVRLGAVCEVGIYKKGDFQPSSYIR